MYGLDIIDTIRNSKKYSSSNFIFEGDYINYVIGDIKYKISIQDDWKKLIFSYSQYKLNVKSIRVAISKKHATEKKVLSKFREVIRDINKLHIFLADKVEHHNKIEPIIKKYIEEKYSFIEPTFELRFSFPNSVYRVGRRVISTTFNVSKETPGKIMYEVLATGREGNFGYSLQFVYNVKEKKLVLHRKEETFTNLSKDATKIIRSEKLKNLIFKNEETI
jgi:hypothetical protein